MQDIAGCRAVMADVEGVRLLVAAYRSSRIKHKLKTLDDYQDDQPQQSGYRGVHLIYRYVGEDRKVVYNSLMVEIQIRTRLQHAWATAVETVDTFTPQALKSGRGESEWLRFFALMGSEFALQEKTPIVPGTPTKRSAIRTELRELADHLDVLRRLRNYSVSLDVTQQVNDPSAKFYLLHLDKSTNVLVWNAYREQALATVEYQGAERANAHDPDVDIVLVSADSLAEMRRGYPNYFRDTTMFTDAVERAIA